MSSFKKHVKPASSGDPNQSVRNDATSSTSLLGLKPWINCGLGLVSCGNKQYDEIIGGGMALGSVTVLGLDNISNHGETLIAYNIAESLSIGHETLLLCYCHSTYDRFMKLLPYNQHYKTSSQNLVKSELLNKTLVTTNDEQDSGYISHETVNSSVNDNFAATMTNTIASDSLKLAASYKKYIDEKERKRLNELNTKSQESNNHNLNGTESSASVTQYCSSYDLSKRLQKDILSRNCLQSVIAENMFHKNETTTTTSTTTASNDHYNTISYSSKRTCIEQFKHVLDHFTVKVQQFMETTIHQKKTIGRIYIPDISELLLCALSASIESLPNAPSSSSSTTFHNYNHINNSSINRNNTMPELMEVFNSFILRIKQMIRVNRVCLVLGLSNLYLPSGTPTSNDISKSITPLISIADNYFVVDSFVGKSQSIPHEFKEFDGFLYVHKLACQGALSSFRPLQNKYGLKRDNRKLNIEPLHLPPEDNRATSSSIQKDISNMNKLSALTVTAQQSSRTQSIVQKGSILYDHSSTDIPQSKNKTTSATNETSSIFSLKSTPSNDSNPTVTATATVLDPATRASLLASKFAKSVSHVSKGSSISISRIQNNNSSNNSMATVVTKSNHSNSSILCSPGNNTSNNDGRLDF